MHNLVFVSARKGFVSTNLVHVSTIHNSAPTYQRPDHKLYGLVDWDRIEGGEYALVDPVDPANVLYMTERDYVVFVRVCLTQATRPVVLATPRDKRPSQDSSSTSSDSPFKNSPPIRYGRGPKDWKVYIQRMFTNVLWAYPRVKRARGVRETIENLVVVSDRNIETLFSYWAKTLSLRIAGFKRNVLLAVEVGAYARTLRTCLQNEGLVGVCKRLQVSLFAINSYLSGNPIRNTFALGYKVRLSNGLPKALPFRVRRMIRARNKVIILIWGSLMYAYKGFDAPHKEPSLDHIAGVWDSNPNFEHAVASFELFIQEFRTWLFGLTKDGFRGVTQSFIVSKPIHRSASAGPNGNPSLLSVTWDVVAWLLVGTEMLREYVKITSNQAMYSKFIECAEHILTRWGYSSTFIELILDSHPASRERLRYDLSNPEGDLLSDLNQSNRIFVDRATNDEVTKPIVTGRLSTILESAGKVRIIAIVDTWSQTLLRPVHDLLFNLLKVLPTDGTFDQYKAVNTFAEEGHKDIFSYDLSKATDTIPYPLYEALFAILFSSRPWAKSWLGLLRDREFLTPTWESRKSSGKVLSKRILHNGSARIRYGRGQPMGAYSSWAALALLHHAVVQYSAWKVGLFPYLDYRVLGDDIVIAGRAVAHSYRDTCNDFGIVIGFAKSFTSSEGFFNFASQSYLGPDNLTPYSLKEELSIGSAASRFSSALISLRKLGISLTDAGFFSSLVRQMAKPCVARAIEVDRKTGTVHGALRYITSLLFGAILMMDSSLINIQGVRFERLVRLLLQSQLSLFTTRLGNLQEDVNHVTWEELSFMYHWVVENSQALRTRITALMKDIKDAYYEQVPPFDLSRPLIQPYPPLEVVIRGKKIGVPTLAQEIFTLLWLDEYGQGIESQSDALTAMRKRIDIILESSRSTYEIIQSLIEAGEMRGEFLDPLHVRSINDSVTEINLLFSELDQIAGPLPECSLLPSELTDRQLLRFFHISDQAMCARELLRLDATTGDGSPVATSSLEVDDQSPTSGLTLGQ